MWLLMAKERSGKLRALVLSILMATISMSAAVPSWDFTTLDSKTTMQTVTSNSTLNLTLDHTYSIQTGLSGNASSGTYDVHSDAEGMYFTSENINNKSKFAMGLNHYCGIFSDGNLKCWGQNYYGQLGIGSTTSHNTSQNVSLGTGRTAVAVSAGTSYTCAILDDGSLKCWGQNSYGQLGIGSTTNYDTPQNVSLGTGRTAVSVDAGDSHTCAILDDGSLKCWGQNSNGQLGIGSTTNHDTPQNVSLDTGRTAVSVSAGHYHTCAILDDGSLKCWGYNIFGQLGIGSTTGHNSTQNVSLGTGRTAVSVSTGQYHTLSLIHI